jgi:O-antigen ligase
MTRGRTRARRGPPAAAGPRTGAPDAGGATAAVVLAGVLLASALLVDPGADAAFDAPKRLATLIGIAAAAAALAALPGGSAPGGPAAGRGAGLEARAALVLALAAVGGAAVAALLAPRRALALDGGRVLALGALLLPLGASRALDGRRGRLVLGAFLAASAVNAVASAWQARGTVWPFRVLSPGGRGTTGGLAGNEGYVALSLALAAVAALGLAVLARGRAARVAAGASAGLFLGGALLNVNLTAVLALAGGSTALLALRFRRRALLPAILVLCVAAGGAAAHPAFRGRLQAAWQDARAGEWDRLVTYRLGPWAAALEMARRRPLTGWGPGTFGAEFVEHRLAAEIRLRARLVNPFLAGAYVEAHSDYLQALAELGVPATVAAVAAAAALLAGLGRVAWRPGAPRGPEAMVLLALLVTGAAAALTWFPLQRPITAVPLLLAAGRGWRLARDGLDGDA